MKKQLTRRQFIEKGAGTSALVTIGLPLAGAARPAPEPAAFSEGEQSALRAAVDEIIPARDGMPSASSVGAVQYIERLASQTPGLKEAFRKGLGLLEEVSRKQFGKGFAQLAGPDRVTVLTGIEQKTAPEFFVSLRDTVYEAYYQRPEVWKLIGYDSHLTDQHGPHMKPFDEAALADVRRKPKFYREVS